MNNNSLYQQCLLVWERDYRSFMQGVRTCLALLSVAIIYFFVQDNRMMFMGVSVLGLSQACTRSHYWRFEINLFLAYFISTSAVIFAYPYSKSFVLICIYIFILTFFIYIFMYYNISSAYSLWIYLIPMYSILSIKTVHDVAVDVCMNTVALTITFFICAIFLRPRLRKECLFEIKSILRELVFYIDTVEIYTFNKSPKSIKLLTKRREKIFSRIQSLRLMMTEIDFYRQKERLHHRNQLFSLFIVANLTERFLESIVGISIKIRVLDVPLEYEPIVRSIFKSMNKTNSDLLKFLVIRKSFTIQELSYLYEKIYLDALIEYKKIEKLSEKYAHDQLFDEIFSSAFQFKDNISLLNSEFKFLCQKE
ncbi:hypothetical protein AXG55_09265 [Silvanigrella aquatica]|uniref:FUSC family protein n=2 Tax=Silvanigrella aquatica TaxID=1915309 RepID=A0A1L4D1J9_9BACT|nr:hypothetical protein AXG55_09265 [Silvanigrella aquatica]